MSTGQDQVERAIGTVGRWQVRLSFLVSLVGLPCGWQVLAIVFLAPNTGHWCAPASDRRCLLSEERPCSPDRRGGPGIQTDTTAGSAGESACLTYSWDADAATSGANVTVPCTSWLYDTSEYTSNIVIEWDLVCDRKWLQMLATGIYMIGIMFGVMTWGMIADKYGRRPALLVCLVLNCVCSTATAASYCVEMFLALRFLSAFFAIGMYTTGFVISMELVGAQWRPLLGITYCLPLSFGFITMGGMAYLIRHWRTLQLTSSLPGLVFIAFYWLVPESPRWLLSKGRVSEAKYILENICKYNDKTPLEKLPEAESTHQENPPNESFLELLRSAKITAYFVCLFFCWLVNSMVFYGITLSGGDFGGNIYLNAVLGGVVEIPALATCAFAIYRLGRRAPISINMVGAGTACLLTLACNKGEHVHDWPIVCLALMGRFCITASFSTIYIYTAELFPTSVRNTCLAGCSVGSRVGGIVAPFLALLRDSVHPAVPVLLFGGSAILSGLSVLLLPETANRPLPEVLDDLSSPAGRRSGRHLVAASPTLSHEPLIAASPALSH